MEGYRALRTHTHIIEPLGYGILKKTVNRGAAVHGAVDQYRIQCIAALFNSSWLSVATPLQFMYPRSYTMSEIVNCHVLSHREFVAYMDDHPELNEEWSRFALFMIKEGYFARGVKIIHCTEGIPFRIIDMSQFGVVQGDTVLFPDQRWKYNIVQAELLYGMR